jgi:putative transposase
LDYTISDQTVGNILKRHGIPPTPKRKKTTTWQEFIRTHLDVLVATDFFTTEVWTWSGLMADWGVLGPGQYLVHDRDTKFCSAFQATIEVAGVKGVVLPARSPNLNAYAERWVRSVLEQCLSRLILFGEGALRHALKEYVDH